MSQTFQPPDQEPPDLVYSDAIEVIGRHSDRFPCA
jgi:hypothetical protein